VSCSYCGKNLPVGGADVLDCWINCTSSDITAVPAEVFIAAVPLASIAAVLANGIEAVSAGSKAAVSAGCTAADSCS
jgi:hypothetical protein